MPPDLRKAFKKKKKKAPAPAPPKATTPAPPVSNAWTSGFSAARIHGVANPNNLIARRGAVGNAAFTQAVAPGAGALTDRQQFAGSTAPSVADPTPAAAPTPSLSPAPTPLTDVGDAAQTDAAAAYAGPGDVKLLGQLLFPMASFEGNAKYNSALVSAMPGFERIHRIAELTGFSPEEVYDAAVGERASDPPMLLTLFEQLGMGGVVAALDEAEPHWSHNTHSPTNVAFWETVLGKWAQKTGLVLSAAGDIAMTAANWWVDDSLGTATPAPDWFRQRMGSPAADGVNTPDAAGPAPNAAEPDMTRQNFLDL